MKSIVAWSAAAAASCLFASTASAHLDLLAPDERYDNGSAQKAGPCGDAANPPSDVRTVVPPGATITVRVEETIPHPGYYRIAFDDDGDDGFVDPVDANDIYNVSEGTNGIVLLDHWLQQPGTANPDAPDERAAEPDLIYEVDVTLPDVECSNCTLQVLQIMTDKNQPDVPFDGNDIYYRCANLTLDANAPDGGVGPADPDAGVDPVGPDAGGDPSNPGDPGDPDSGVSGGCAAGGDAGAGGILLLGLALAILRRRHAGL